MSGFVKAAISGLQNQPIIIAVIDGDDIIYRDYIDISIAVGTPKGLVVPVIRNAEKMNFAEIEKEINTLAKKANNGTISIDEMAGVSSIEACHIGKVRQRSGWSGRNLNPIRSSICKGKRRRFDRPQPLT